MILVIDATNIRKGGGLTHLYQLISNYDIVNDKFRKVIVWSSIKTLSKLPELDWLEKKTNFFLNKSFIFSLFFQTFFLSFFLRSDKCDLLFVPGGTYLGTFKNIVSMSQNMLPFQKEERNRFSSLITKIRFIALKFTQSITFRKSIAVIYLTNFAKEVISNQVKLKNKSIVIPHGINKSFIQKPRAQKNINYYSSKNPFILLYVSYITAYKHQWNVAEAVLRLKYEGYPICLDLVGEIDSGFEKKILEVLKNDVSNCINLRGPVAHEKLSNFYKNSNGFIFASSCENLPIILLEAMSSGLPIVSSHMGPMKEVLGDSGFYFDPLFTDDIYRSLKQMLDSKKLRQIKSNDSFNKSIRYTWKDCSQQTFKYLSSITNSN